VRTPEGRTEFRALGTGTVVMTTDPDAIRIAEAVARAEIDAVDRACSRFRDDSDLERLNRSAGRPTVVGDVLLEALDVAMEAARFTDGDLDPTIGHSLRLLGYDRDFGRVCDGPAIARFAEVAGWQVVEIDREHRRVRMPSGVRLDLGATAKAFAADRAAASASRAADCGVLVSIGGDIACSGPPPADGWPVRVMEWHAADIDEDGEDIVVFDGGLATSSTTVRRWSRGAVAMHHLIDPATGQPATEFWRTVTIAAGSCVQANIVSTTTIVRGERGLDWVMSLGVPARLVRRNGEVLHCGAWPNAVMA
jgi:thiamine biosynthesis lipoprotein